MLPIYNIIYYIYIYKYFIIYIIIIIIRHISNILKYGTINIK